MRVVGCLKGDEGDCGMSYSPKYLIVMLNKVKHPCDDDCGKIFMGEYCVAVSIVRRGIKVRQSSRDSSLLLRSDLRSE